MYALEAARSPLSVCLEQLQHSAGPAASSENATALLAKLLGERTTLQACSQIVLRDVGLTLRLLRIANSVLFNQSGRTVISVTHGCALMGTDALGQIVDAVPRTALPQPARELVFLCRLTAGVAGRLMARLEPRWAEEAFIAGLFRNLGEVTFCLERPDEYREILAGSQGHLTGLRASCRSRMKFDFDELAAGLLEQWSFHGSPVLAAQSTPDALLAQLGKPETSVALAASVAHAITTACFRAEPAERDHALKHCWPALSTCFHMREPQVSELCESTLDRATSALSRQIIQREGLRLKEWLPKLPATPAGAAPAALDLPAAADYPTLLHAAIAKGIDRAAWLEYRDGTARTVELAGEGWPDDAAGALPELLSPHKPPFLLAFGQRQDVWIDFTKDDRFQHSALALRLRPLAFYLLPVCQNRKVAGCFYFDWRTKRDYAPETLLPALIALRDFKARTLAA